MLEKIKEALRKAGLPEDMAKLVNVSKEEEIEGVVNELKTHFKNEMQREGDKRATEATKTSIQNFKKKLGLDPNMADDEVKKLMDASQNPGGSPGGQQTTGQQTGNQGGGQTQPNDEVSTLKQELSEVKKMVNDMTSKQQTVERRKNFIEKAKQKNIPETTASKFADHIDFTNLDSDEKLDTQVGEVEKTLQSYYNEALQKSVEEGGSPGSPSEPENVEEHIKSAVKQRYEPEAESEGKKV